MDARSIKPVGKKRNWRENLILVSILLGLAVVILAGKGVYDLTTPTPLPVYSEIEIDLDRNGTGDLSILKVKVVKIKRDIIKGTTLVVQGDAPDFLASSRQP